MVTDKNGNLWVLCSGGYLNEENPTLWKIDAVSRQLLAKFTFDDINTNPDNLERNVSGDSLFFLNRGVYKMAITDNSLPDQAFIQEDGGQYFLYLGVDPVNGAIFTSDALDYTKNGFVFRYGANGNFLGQLDVGIIPGPFGFNYLP
jgi:hypothetical protein